MIQIDMDMPKSCTKCRFNSCCDDCICVPNYCKAVDFDDDDKAIIGRFRDWHSDEEPEEGYTPETRRMEWCPLMENGDGWIPVTERLPKRGQEVICQCRANIIEVLKLDANGDWYQDAEHCYMSGFVIAWMPLPEPYQEADHD